MGLMSTDSSTVPVVIPVDAGASASSGDATPLGPPALSGGLTSASNAPSPWWRSGEVWVAVALFAGFAALVLTKASALLEPDDYAYRASIIALSRGHLTLTPAQYQALQTQLASGTGGGLGGQGIMQWVQLANGNWISEKNPGYPFLALPFQLLAALRLAPLFYGALGCIGLFVGARRWLGRWGGTWAVAMFLGSGAALVFAWRATMPTFTDASLIAAGTGALLWAFLARERTARRRITVGLLAFLAIEAAVAVRYTNVVFLVVAAAAAVLVVGRTGLPRRALAWWLGSVGVFAGAVLLFDQLVYGSALKTGYSSGEITFSLGSILPNLTHLPSQLLRAIPGVALAVVAIGWVAVRVLRRRRASDPVRRAMVRSDAVAVAFIAAGWLGIWALYSAYDWTARMSAGSGGSVHLIRFYVPALGAIALLAAWTLAQLPRWLPAVLVAGAVVLAVPSYHALAASSGPGGGPGGGPGRVGNQGGPGGPQGGQPPNGQVPPNGQIPPNGQAPPNQG